jgi:hypothetical protein
MTLRSAAKTLLLLAVALPIVGAVLVWVAGLLQAMGDPAGVHIIVYFGVVCEVVWSISLVGLVIILAIITLNEPPERQE